MGFFKPSARVLFRARLEEYDDTDALTSRLKTEIPKTDQTLAAPSTATETDLQEELSQVQGRIKQFVKLKKLVPVDSFKSQLASLQRQRDTLQQRLDALREGESQPEVIAGPSPDDRTVSFEMLPRNFSIERNGLHEADTCDIEVDFISFPVDPRIIRQIAVEVIVGVVRDEEYESGMQGVNRSPDGRDFLMSVVGREGGISTPQTKFIGFVDNIESEWTDSGDTLKCRCRDMTSLLIDLPLPPGASIDLSLPLVLGVQSFLDSIPGLQGIPVRFGKPGETDDIGPIPGSKMKSILKARRKKKTRRARQGDQNMKTWDHILDACTSIGFTPLFYGYTLHLINPRTFFSDGGGSGGGLNEEPKRMVWGENLSDLSFSRTLRPMAAPTVEVRSFDASTGRTLWARYPVKDGTPATGVYGVSDPPKPTRANNPGVSGSAPTDKVAVFPIQGITDPEQLKFVAFTTYNQVGRQEIEGSLTTCDIDSSGAEPLSGDLLNLNVGDGIEILMINSNGPRDTTTTSAQDLYSLAREERANYFKALGWDEKVAEKIAALQDATGFQTTFRVQNLTIDWDVDSGLEIKIDFVNFVIVRNAEGSSTITQSVDPSPEVGKLAKGRQTAEASRGIDVSSERRRLTRMRSDGKITEDEYQEGLKDALEHEKTSVREIKRQ